jgi:hypothetical protein
MKTTRLLLIFAAALSLGLAVFANVRTNNRVATSTQSTFKVADDLPPPPPGDDDDDDDSGSGGGSNSGHMV